MKSVKKALCLMLSATILTTTSLAVLACGNGGTTVDQKFDDTVAKDLGILDNNGKSLLTQSLIYNADDKVYAVDANKPQSKFNLSYLLTADYRPKGNSETIILKALDFPIDPDGSYTSSIEQIRHTPILFSHFNQGSLIQEKNNNEWRVLDSHVTITIYSYQGEPNQVKISRIFGVLAQDHLVDTALSAFITNSYLMWNESFSDSVQAGMTMSNVLTQMKRDESFGLTANAEERITAIEKFSTYKIDYQVYKVGLDNSQTLQADSDQIIANSAYRLGVLVNASLAKVVVLWDGRPTLDPSIGELLGLTDAKQNAILTPSLTWDTASSSYYLGVSGIDCQTIKDALFRQTATGTYAANEDVVQLLQNKYGLDVESTDEAYAPEDVVRVENFITNVDKQIHSLGAITKNGDNTDYMIGASNLTINMVDMTSPTIQSSTSISTLPNAHLLANNVKNIVNAGYANLTNIFKDGATKDSFLTAFNSNTYYSATAGFAKLSSLASFVNAPLSIDIKTSTGQAFTTFDKNLEYKVITSIGTIKMIEVNIGKPN